MTQHLTNTPNPVFPSRREFSPRPVVSVALAVLVHGALLVAGSFRGTYDAYVHIFLGDHYARRSSEQWCRLGGTLGLKRIDALSHSYWLSVEICLTIFS